MLLLRFIIFVIATEKSKKLARDDVTSAFNFKVWSPTTLKVLTNAFNFKIRSQTKVKVLTYATDLIIETRRQPTQHSKILKFQKPARK